jgi:hypothetical protein
MKISQYSRRVFVRLKRQNGRQRDVPGGCENWRAHICHTVSECG